MCYPCTMCNGCGKLDQEMFGFLKPRLLCLACNAELSQDAECCPQCGTPRPAQPGQAAHRHVASTSGKGT
jgi:rRNA maturation endonuclease Nob1